MGELILARTGVAANPYYIDELSLNIYSLEELSYYIYHNVWLLILTENGYLTTREIRDTLSVLKSFENKSEAECRKMRADRLMKNGRIVDSVYEYENLLKKESSFSLFWHQWLKKKLEICPRMSNGLF